MREAEAMRDYFTEVGFDQVYVLLDYLEVGDSLNIFLDDFPRMSCKQAIAVKRGLELDPKKVAKVMLLSPVCANFDQCQSFEHRGDDFRALSLALL